MSGLWLTTVTFIFFFWTKIFSRMVTLEVWEWLNNTMATKDTSTKVFLARKQTILCLQQQLAALWISRQHIIYNSEDYV